MPFPCAYFSYQSLELNIRRQILSDLAAYGLNPVGGEDNPLSSRVHTLGNLNGLGSEEPSVEAEESEDRGSEGIEQDKGRFYMACPTSYFALFTFLIYS